MTDSNILVIPYEHLTQGPIIQEICDAVRPQLSHDITISRNPIQASSWMSYRNFDLFICDDKWVKILKDHWERQRKDTQQQIPIILVASDPISHLYPSKRDTLVRLNLVGTIGKDGLTDKNTWILLAKILEQLRKEKRPFTPTAFKKAYNKINSQAKQTREAQMVNAAAPSRNNTPYGLKPIPKQLIEQHNL